MKLVLVFGVVLYSCFAWSKEAAVDTIYFGVNANNTMPIIEVTNPLHSPQIERGLLKELGEALAAELKVKITWIPLPKNRIATSLVSGNIDLICHSHETWQNSIRNDVFWSNGLYISENVIIHTGKKRIQKIKDLHGEHVGAVTNFVYKDLEPAFERKEIIREDAPTNQSNIQKLFHGRLDYVVMSNLEYDYYGRIYPIIKRSELKMDHLRTKCALSKKSKITLAQLNRAIDLIKKSGDYQKIIKRYTDQPL